MASPAATVAVLLYALHLLLSPPDFAVHCRRSRLLSSLPSPACSLLTPRTDRPSSLIDYFSLHCSVPAPLSLPLLSLLSLLYFYILATTAGRHFSPCVSALSARLRLSPSMAAATLLALGNGAPDAFAAAAALRGGLPRAGLAAVVSAGTFVSALVVGAVALQAAPFSVPPGPFVRDVFFYIVAATGLFYVYLSGEIYLWQAVGFVMVYVFFVGLVFYMDLFSGAAKGKECEVDCGTELDGVVVDNGAEDAMVMERHESEQRKVCSGPFLKVWRYFELTIDNILRLTIPATSPSEWSRFYFSANIGLCPIMLLFSLSTYVPLDSKIIFFIPQSPFPLWSIVLFVSLSLAVSHFILEKEPPEAENVAVTSVSFMMSVFWISTMAGELLSCLAAIGIIMKISPPILGLTVLAWGNSVGDLVGDVALAKSGQPAIAMAGCFAGPMFNMLVGFGSALVYQSAMVYPEAYKLRFHVSIVVAFVFLLLSLMGTLLVVAWCRFRVPRFWGYFLVGLYLLFTVVSLGLSGSF